MYFKWPALAVAGVLLPTIVHVSLFTLVFMGLGAWRAHSRPQAALIAAYLGGMLLVLVLPPTDATAIPILADVTNAYFGNVGKALGALFGTGDLALDRRLTGFLAFIYAYHYLNWFIKAEVIRWADIPAPRWLVIGSVSALSTGVYFYDYALGFSVLLALSLIHVLLEFPLNALAARQLVEALAHGMPDRRRSAAKPAAQRSGSH
jgi:hypothetical protein